jgi:hypothetical protein
MENKIKFLQSSIENLSGFKLCFDYVSADNKVSFGKQVKPVEVKKPYLWAEDLLANNMIKRYLIDGIQKPSIQTDDGQVIEFIDE